MSCVCEYCEQMPSNTLREYESLNRYYDSKRSAAKKEQKTVEAAQKVSGDVTCVSNCLQVR